MSVEKDIRTYLLAQSNISDVVGTRIWADKLPEDATLPAITYKRLSSIRTYSQSGDSNLKRSRFQFSCFAEGKEGSQDLADVLTAELSGYKGVMGDSTIQASFIENETDMYEPETKRYFVPVDVLIYH